MRLRLPATAPEDVRARIPGIRVAEPVQGMSPDDAFRALETLDSARGRTGTGIDPAQALGPLLDAAGEAGCGELVGAESRALFEERFRLHPKDGLPWRVRSGVDREAAREFIRSWRRRIRGAIRFESAEGALPEASLDLRTPEEAEGPRLSVVSIHGGGPR